MAKSILAFLPLMTNIHSPGLQPLRWGFFVWSDSRSTGVLLKWPIMHLFLWGCVGQLLDILQRNEKRLNEVPG